jgi:hypothetical protein
MHVIYETNIYQQLFIKYYIISIFNFNIVKKSFILAYIYIVFKYYIKGRY